MEENLTFKLWLEFLDTLENFLTNEKKSDYLMKLI